MFYEKLRKLLLNLPGDRWHEDEGKDYNIDNINLGFMSEEMHPLVIKEHLNNSLIKMDLKFNKDILQKN